MSATDALTITSALDALTRYYCAKEREESAVLYINDAYLEVLNSLENLEAENDKLQNDADLLRAMLSQVQTEKRCYMAENAKLREDVDRLIQAVEDLHDVSLEDSLVQMENENARLREYVTKLEAANLDVTARLTDYIGQYDPTDAFVAEVKAENAKLREACAELLKIAERHDPEWLHWPEMHEELRKLRVEVDDD